MNEEQKKALDKIKKCLNLSASSNPEEAEAALRQANALMARYKLDFADVELSDVDERKTKASAKDAPVKHEAWLASACAEAFDCRVLFSHAGFLENVGQWTFIGVGSTAELASYCFEVLFRQLKKDRKAYQDTKLKRYGRKNKIALADVFSLHWVDAIENKLRQITSDKKRLELVAAYIEKQYPNLNALKTSVNAGNVNPDKIHDARQSGRQAGESANLHRGINGGKTQAALEHRT